MKKSFLLFVAVLLGCTLVAQVPSGQSVLAEQTHPTEQIQFSPGQGSLVYIYKGIPNKPIVLHYYIPTQGDVKHMPILFSMAGAERSAAPQISVWKAYAESKGFIVLAPEYDKKSYPENDYQFGGVMESETSTTSRPKAQWTYSSIEDIFDACVKALDSDQKTYMIYGHSAGGQFVHRFLLAMPEARVSKACAANPGSWTYPYLQGFSDESGKIYGWPYSLKNTPFADDATIKKFFTRDLVLIAGSADTITNSKNFPKLPVAMAQGSTRFERSKRFYKASQELAQKLGCPFRLQWVEIPGVGHAGKAMVQQPKGAYYQLFENK